MTIIQEESAETANLASSANLGNSQFEIDKSKAHIQSHSLSLPLSQAAGEVVLDFVDCPSEPHLQQTSQDEMQETSYFQTQTVTVE